MDYEKYLELNRDEMIFALRDVVRSNSQESEKIMNKNGEVFPFGSGVQEVFEKVLTLGESMGFTVKNVDNYGGHIEFPGKTQRIMAIIGHLDVVPAGSGWDFDPYGGELADGKICGRGTTDNKGPVISCLYAMKALKDAGYIPECTIRLILGLDEETNWNGMNYYFEHERKPDFGFTPDADFPVINGEKGMLIFEIAKKFSQTQTKGLRLRSLKGGTAPNSVADFCRAVLLSEEKDAYERIREAISQFREETGYKLNSRGVGKSLEITATGISSHGAKPEQGLNAISIMMEFLGRLNFVSEDQNEFIEFYNRNIGFCLDGSLIGAYCCDQPSGGLIFNVGMVEMDPEAGRLTINIRYPVTADGEEILDRLAAAIDKYDMGLIRQQHKKPIYMDMNSPMVKLLLEIYRKHTGDEESQPMVIGGGTYARCADNVVAYGAMFPGDPDLMHQKNECITVERFVQMTKIYAEAIYKLSSGEYNV